MKNNTLGGYSSIPAFVKAKLDRMEQMEPSFFSLFKMMFSERDNVLYERSVGYRIEETTYGAAYDNVLCRIPALQKLLSGVPKQSIIGLFMSNSVEWIEVFWAILGSGYRPLLMNLHLDKQTLEEILQQCNAAAVISDGGTFGVKTISPDEVVGDVPCLPEEQFGEEVLVMSSGTSEHVKLCAYTAEAFVCQARNTLSILRRSHVVQQHYEGRLKLLAFLPFYHVFGLIAVYFWFAFFSRTFVHLQDLAPQTILNVIRRHKVTHIFAVPLFWETVYNEAMRTIRNRGEKTVSRFEKGLSAARRLGNIPMLGSAFSSVAFREVRENLFGESVSFMITGGSEIKTEVLEFFNAIGYPLSNGYGMTEIGITSVELNGRLSVLSSGSVGMPMESVEYDISPAGELLVRGSSLAHYTVQDGVRRENDGNWFHTGDLAERIKNRYRILGRMDDMIVASTGENLNPNLIEARFDIPGIKRVCLIADADGAPVLLASVGRHRSSQTLLHLTAQLRSRVSELGLSSHLRHIVLVENDLLAEQDFKLCRSKIAKAYAAGAFSEAVADSCAEAPKDPVFDRVTELFAQALDKDAAEIGPEMDFFLDCGGSSLDYFAFITKLREEFSADFPTADGESLSTPLALYHYIVDGER